MQAVQTASLESLIYLLGNVSYKTFILWHIPYALERKRGILFIYVYGERFLIYYMSIYIKLFCYRDGLIKKKPFSFQKAISPHWNSSLENAKKANKQV